MCVCVCVLSRSVMSDALRGEGCVCVCVCVLSRSVMSDTLQPHGL